MSPHIHRWGDEGSLFIHCALAHGGVLRSLAEALGGGVAFDLPGHGKSPPWDQALDYQEQTVDWALSLLDRPRHVLGHSFGGTAALRLAVEHPGLVSELTLVEPVFFAALRLHDPDAYATHQDSFAGINTAFEAGDFPLMAERFTNLWGGASWENLPRRFRDGIAAQMPLIIAQGDGIEKDSGDVFASGRLEGLECPVTLLRGSDSNPTVAAIHRVLLGLLPNAKEQVIDGAGHMAPLTHPQEVAALIRPSAG